MTLVLPGFELEDVTPKRKGNTRVTGKEQYYTPADLAEFLVSRMLNHVPDLASKTVLEPAGGTGSFISAAQKFGVRNFISYDIEPHHPEVKQGDFLAESLFGRQGLITITNPPFGRNNSLSIPFFNKSAEYSDYIGFLVPRSWRKWSVLNRLDRNFHLVEDVDVDIDYVDESGVPVSTKSALKTCFQIWERRNSLRELVEVKDHGYISKVSFDTADVSLTVFGYGCGTVKTEFPRKPNTTQMFLRINHPLALEALQNVDFSKFYNNTAYTEALSLKEINFLINEYIQNRISK